MLTASVGAVTPRAGLTTARDELAMAFHGVFKSALTVERLRQLLSYNSETGRFHRLERRPRQPVGAVAGTRTIYGYINITLDGERYYAQRLVWLYVYGCWPCGIVDHINGHRDDNRLANLRDVEPWQNTPRPHFSPPPLPELQPVENVAAPLTHEIVRKSLHYDQETGFLRWLITPVSGNRRAGDTAGTDHGPKYRSIDVGGRHLKEHRLIWFWMTGGWPKKAIDHINGNGKDNRWSNLREATATQNAVNAPVRNRRRPGVLRGAYPNKNRWQAVIRDHGKLRHLGMFATAEEAHAAYCKAAAELHGEFARYD